MKDYSMKIQINWLKKYFNFSIELLMRKNNDKRNKRLVKKEIYKVFLADRNIQYAIDDDDDLLSMWREWVYKQLMPKN